MRLMKRPVTPTEIVMHYACIEEAEVRPGSLPPVESALTLLHEFDLAERVGARGASVSRVQWEPVFPSDLSDADRRAMFKKLHAEWRQRRRAARA
jgi:hypothetical protein